MSARKATGEFSFSYAFLFAVVAHVLLAFFAFRYQPAIALNPLARPAPQRSPVTMRFVEVPPNARTVSEPPPNARYFSDANRKAGPIQQKTPARKPQSTQLAQIPGRPGRPAPQAAPRQSPSPPPQREPVKVDRTPESNTTEGFSGPSNQSGSAEKLAQSLKNLEKFLPSRGGSGGSGGTGSGEASGGDFPSGDPGSGVFFDTRGFDLGPWANEVIALVKRNWIIPVASQLGLKGVVAVSFQVARNGKILNPKVISSSTIPPFDQAALNALKTSDPFPPLPADFPREVLPAVFRFYYNMPVPE